MATQVDYEHPVIGLVAPTALQTIDQVTATVIEDAGAAVNVAITHNMGLSAADLAAGRPHVILEPIDGGGVFDVRTQQWVVSAKAANTITVSSAGVGAGDPLPQLRVHIKRPHTIGR